MRVALISPLFESVPPRFYGGTERVIHNLCIGLKKAGVEVTVFASGDSDVPAHLIPVIPQAMRLGDRPIADTAAYHQKLLSVVARHADDFDVLHNHHDYWMLPLSQMTDVPLLSTLHGRLDLPDIELAFLGWPRSRFVSISQSQRTPMPGLPWVRTIPHGIPFEGLHFQAKPGNYLAFLGRVDPDKGTHLAIQLALEAGIPLKIAAKIEGQPSQDYFEARVKPHLDGRNIEYIGEIGEHEKSDFLGQALALAFPIDWPEPFGLVMVEALACGTPVLARPCGSVPEVLRHGVTGFVDPDVQVLARHAAQGLPGISRLACRSWVEERFSLQRMTEDYIDVYQGLAAGSARRGLAAHRRDLVHPFERPPF